jgi:hypothetical protein
MSICTQQLMKRQNTVSLSAPVLRMTTPLAQLSHKRGAADLPSMTCKRVRFMVFTSFLLNCSCLWGHVSKNKDKALKNKDNTAAARKGVRRYNG